MIFDPPSEKVKKKVKFSSGFLGLLIEMTKSVKKWIKLSKKGSQKDPKRSKKSIKGQKIDKSIEMA